MTVDPATSRRLALLIATSRHQDPAFSELRGAAGDVEALGRVLADPTIGQFEIAGSLLDATKQEIEEAISEFFRSARPSDLLLLYLSGHGFLSENRRHWYFAAANTRQRDLDATAVWDAWLRERMANSRSNSVVLVLDCCHSGQFIKGRTAKGTSEVHVEERFSDAGTGRITMTASTDLEYAFEGPSGLLDIGSRSPGSLFTQHLVEGLQTRAADADLDGRVSADELFRYVQRKLQAETPKQTPGWGGESFGPIWLAHGRRSTITPEVWAGIRSEDDSMREAMVGVLQALGTRLAAADDRDGSEEVRAALAQLADDERSAAVREAAGRACEQAAPSTDVGAKESAQAPNNIEASVVPDDDYERCPQPRGESDADAESQADVAMEPQIPSSTEHVEKPATPVVAGLDVAGAKDDATSAVPPESPELERPREDSIALETVAQPDTGRQPDAVPKPETRVSSPPPPPQRTTARLVGLLIALFVGSIVAWIVVSSGDPPPEQADNATTPGPTATATATPLSRAETSLLGLIPRSVRGDCSPFNGAGSNLQAALACTRPDYTVYYSRYRNREAMNKQYQRVADRFLYGSPGDVAACRNATDSTFAGNWSRNGARRGKLACGIDTGDSRMIVWTDDRHRVQGHLEHTWREMSPGYDAWQRASRLT